MNNTSDPDAPYWLGVHSSFLSFLKVAFPVLTIISQIGTALLFIILLWKKKTIRYPATSNLAICWLLLTDLGHLTSRWPEYLGKVGFLPYRVRDASVTACYGWVILYAFFTVQQSYIQSVISVERCLAILYPLKVKTIFTWRRMLATLIITSVFGFIITVIHVGYGFALIDGRCDPNPAHGVQMAIYTVITWVLLPGVILVTCTACIVTVLIKRLRKVELAVRRKNLSSPEIRLSLMLVVMDTVFMVTSLPLSIFYFQLHYKGTTPKLKVAWEISLFFMSLGSFTDWLIILVLGGQIRRAILSVVREGTQSSSLAMASSNRPSTERR